MGLSPRPAILLAGATGLVGGALLERLLAGPADGPRVLAPVRRPPGIEHPRLQAILPAGQGGESVDAALQDLRVGSFVSCLGTTLRQAGSREAFLAVDRDLVLSLAAIARRHGATHAVLVSSVGASAQSGNFYLRVKGETERGLAELGFERLDLVRPGLLQGERRERRPGEAIARRLAPLFNPLLAGPLRRYRAIPAADVAAAIAALLSRDDPGRFEHEYASLRSLAAGAAGQA